MKDAPMKTYRYVIPVAMLALNLSGPVVAGAVNFWEGPMLHGWQIYCHRDAMDDTVACVASQKHLKLAIIGPKAQILVSLAWSATGPQHYPGTVCALRVDSLPAQRTTEECDWVAPDAVQLLRAMQRGQSILTRYTAWPTKLLVEERIDLAGFLAVWAALQDAYVAQVGMAQR
jgi:hypothetical protein